MVIRRGWEARRDAKLKIFDLGSAFNLGLLERQRRAYLQGGFVHRSFLLVWVSSRVADFENK